MHSPLGDMEEMGLPVSWAVVRAGWQGIGMLERQLAAQQVKAFVQERIGTAEDGLLADVAVLCFPADDQAIGSALACLAPSVPGRAVRTWHVYLLAQLLGELPDDPVDGLCELTHFWGALDFPEGMPHVVQGRRNTVGPQEYYGQDSYRRPVSRHRVWLRREVAALAGGNDPSTDSQGAS